MTKMLNLDELPTSQVERSIVLNKVTHEMQPLDVERFVELNLMTEALQRDASNPVRNVEAMVAMIHAVFPTTTEAELRKTSLAKLQAIIDFVSTRGEEIVEQATAADGEAAGKN